MLRFEFIISSRRCLLRRNERRCKKVRTTANQGAAPGLELRIVNLQVPERTTSKKTSRAYANYGAYVQEGYNRLACKIREKFSMLRRRSASPVDALAGPADTTVRTKGLPRLSSAPGRALRLIRLQASKPRCRHSHHFPRRPRPVGARVIIFLLRASVSGLLFRVIVPGYRSMDGAALSKCSQGSCRPRATHQDLASLLGPWPDCVGPSSDVRLGLASPLTG
jgi:hypothetical protein